MDPIPRAKQPPRRIAVIGGGFAGLSAAYYLLNPERISRDDSTQPPPSVTLFESTANFGGVVRSVRRDGFLIEQSADSFIANEKSPWARDLAVASGFADQLLPTNEQHRRALVLHGQATLPIPAGFRLLVGTKIRPVLTSRLLSPAGKLRLLRERFIPAAPDKAANESLREFAVRRVGQEAYERLVQPLVSGIYTADPERLSIAAALPQFVELERRYGSLTAGLKQQSKREQANQQQAAGARYGIFQTAKNGLQSFAEHVTEKIRQTAPESLQSNSHVESLTQTEAGWQIGLKTATSNAKGREGQSFDSVILALPAAASATLIRNTSSTLADELDSIEHAGVAVACFGYRRDQVGHPLDAFGLVVPTIENRDVIAISFSSQKFPDRAPEGCVLFRVFLAGAMRPDLLELDDAGLLAKAESALGTILSVKGTPLMRDLARWSSVTPQYHVGHLDRVERIEKLTASLPGLELAGNAFRGIGLPQCIRSGKTAAENLI